MLSSFRFVLVIYIAAFFAAPLTATGQHARVYVSLVLAEPNREDALQNRAVTFVSATSKHAFSIGLFNQIISGSLATFTDTSCTQPLPVAEAKQRLHPYISGRPGEVSVHAVLHLYANDSAGRSTVSHVRITIEDSASTLPQLSFICKNRDVLVRMMRDAPRNYGYFVPSVKRTPAEFSHAHSYRIDSIRLLTKQAQLLNDLALNQIPELLFQATPEQAQLMERAEPTIPIWFSLPQALNTTNSIPGYPKALPARMLQNQAFFTTVAPRLLKEILTGKIKVKYPLQSEIFPLPKLHQTVASHPRVKALGRVDKKLASKHDLSFGVYAVEVGGVLAKRKNGITFQAQAMRLVWQDTTQFPETITLGQFLLSNRQLTRLQVNEKPLAEFFAAQAFYHYPIQVNDTYPQTLAEALYIHHLLSTGQWKALPVQRDLLNTSPHILIQRLKSVPEPTN